MRDPMKYRAFIKKNMEKPARDSVFRRILRGERPPLDRGALRRLLDAVRAGAVRRVLVYKLDRISRNLADFTQLLRLFEAHHVAFESHTERFETASPMGQAMQSLLMVFAQLERETISGRVRDAAFSRAKAGFDTGGPPPFGFRKVPHTILGRRTQMLAPDDNAALIRSGFLQYLQDLLSQDKPLFL